MWLPERSRKGHKKYNKKDNEKRTKKAIKMPKRQKNP